MVNLFKKKCFNPRATNQVRFESYLDEGAGTIELHWYNITDQEASFIITEPSKYLQFGS